MSLRLLVKGFNEVKTQIVARTSSKNPCYVGCEKRLCDLLEDALRAINELSEDLSIAFDDDG